MKQPLRGLVLLVVAGFIVWYFDGKLNRIDEVMLKLGVFCLALACFIIGVFLISPVLVAERSLERPAECGEEHFGI